MPNLLSNLVFGAVVLTASSALAGGWKFTVTEGIIGLPGTCNSPVWVACTATRDSSVPYVLGTLSAAPGASIIKFSQDLSGRVNSDNHTLLSFVSNNELPAQQFNVSGKEPNTEINIELNANPQHQLSGIIDVAYRGRIFGFLSLQGNNNLWNGYWVTRQGGNVHRFVARSEWIP